MTALPDVDVVEVGRRLRAGELTAAALLEAHLARVAERDGSIGAFWVVAEDRARAAANATDANLAVGVDRGPLMGVPFAVKDTIDMAGFPTTCGSAVMADRVAARDATVVARLVAGGAVPLGKVATYDLGTVGPSFDLPRPPARNPWDPAHVTGGSSSGSAAAVAGRLVRVALGSDTAGSIRSPAAYCGCVGLKPTSGLVPDDGVFSLAPTLDTVGAMGASVGDAALLLDAIAGTRTAAALGEGVAGLRLGYARAWFAGDPELDPRVLARMDDAASALSLLGAQVEEVELPDYRLMEAAGAVILHVEGLELHRAAMRDASLPHGRQSYKSLAAGVVLSPEDREGALALAPRLAVGVDAALEGRDALLTATTLTTAPALAAFEKGAVWTPMRTLPFNVTGHPALSVPAGLVGGLPMGLQVIGRRGGEAMVCRVAAAFERATDHALVRPPIAPGGDRA